MGTLFRKVVNTSVGAAVLAKNRADNVMKAFQEKSRETEEKGQEILNEYNDMRKDRQNIFEEEVKSLIEKVLQKMNIPTRSELKTMEKRIEVLEKALNGKNPANE